VQENLKYVNTSLATFAGVEWYAEAEATRHLSSFATLKYVEGTDNSRQGSFATIAAEPGMPSTRDYERPRGFYSGVAGGASEPLPSILPLEVRIGLRFHPIRRRQRNDVNRDDARGNDGSEDEVSNASWNQQEPRQTEEYTNGQANDRSTANYQSDRSGRQPRDSLPDDRWGIELSARIVNDQSRVATSLLESPTPGFTVWDLRTFWRPQKNMLLVSGVENFTDKNYREHLDFRSFDGTVSMFQPGVSFYVGGEVTY
jgi:hypothetical protein